MEKYFETQAKEINGVVQLQYYIIETDLGIKPDGSRHVKLDLMTLYPVEIPRLADLHEFVRYSTKSNSLPVFRLK